MEFTFNFNILDKKTNTCAIISVFKNKELSNIGNKLNIISNNYILCEINNSGLNGKINQSLLLHNVPNIKYKRLLIIGCGNKKKFNINKYINSINKIINIIKNTNIKKIHFFLTELNIYKLNIYWKIRKAIELIEDKLYVFNKFKNKKKTFNIKKIIFYINKEKNINLAIIAIKQGIAISNSIKIVKDISNLPPNICNSSYLSMRSYRLQDIFPDKIKVFNINEKDMKKLEMNAYLSVGRESENESLMSIIKYSNHKNINKKPIVFIGKGVTFDSGGISLKNHYKMDEMKYDMCAASVVYGLMVAIAKLELPLNVIGILACCENMLGGNSYRPGDIIKTMSGINVEIINTDAEGRLIICDVLTYVKRFNPEIVIDIATLTGACIIALGNKINGLMSNSNTLSKELLNSAKISGDCTWLLPIKEEYKKKFNSKFADIVNINNNNSGGAIFAACFLSYFAKNYKWAHLDIAGTSHYNNIGATGRPLYLLIQFLLKKSKIDIPLY
ncbi:Cytosol aminopeptidase [Candidatus Annandia adelgestsuga]|uniref:Probable cytosol aminopeptidase n=1 Tax=Candidatus Annandia adelgestsuga TaxID=1302411 RepID=A0A3Q9CM87_9ENTR|nr:leucyl aminopeptidase [Candidatus Annandia adelgestsuga]AZP36311.1 Cytosol aminopeptidase [Candidatus Annandia adelgestsuga]